jgi:hypothetical protein
MEVGPAFAIVSLVGAVSTATCNDLYGVIMAQYTMTFFMFIDVIVIAIILHHRYVNNPEDSEL